MAPGHVAVSWPLCQAELQRVPGSAPGLAPQAWPRRAWLSGGPRTDSVPPGVGRGGTDPRPPVQARWGGGVRGAGLGAWRGVSAVSLSLAGGGACSDMCISSVCVRVCPGCLAVSVSFGGDTRYSSLASSPSSAFHPLLPPASPRAVRTSLPRLCPQCRVRQRPCPIPPLRPAPLHRGGATGHPRAGVRAVCVDVFLCCLGGCWDGHRARRGGGRQHRPGTEASPPPV